MNRGTWLRARREALKNSQKGAGGDYSLRGVAAYAGVSPAGLSVLERSDAMPTLDLAMKLAKYYGKSVEWVLTGKDTAPNNGIPIVGDFKSGPSAAYLAHGIRTPDEYSFVDLPTSEHRRCFALRVNEEASSPAYRTGDFAIFDPAEAHIVGEDHLVKFSNGDTVPELLILLAERDGQFTFASVNDGQKRLVKSFEDIAFLYPVLSVARSFVVTKFAV